MEYSKEQIEEAKRQIQSLMEDEKKSEEQKSKTKGQKEREAIRNAIAKNPIKKRQ